MNAKTVELHLLQSFPPSCVNRDGNNSPKDCTFGDARRARISSQCIKRAIRQAESFAETMGEAIATRTKQMRDKKLVPHLLQRGLTQQAAEEAADSFRRELAKDDSKRQNQTSVGLYFGDAEILGLLDAFHAGDAKWKGRSPRKSPDVALFGRMLAEATDLGVDAAAQVAHAISTHKLSQEMDYWTAADDLKDRSEGEDSGAGMLGNAEFNASVFYRYACVNLDQLGRNLGEKNEKGEWPNGSDLTTKTVKAFLLASYDAIPTGKLNGHAHFTPPFFALAVVRKKGMPLNLCNAFLDPVRAKTGRNLGLLSAMALFEQLAHSRCMAPVDAATHIYAHDLPTDPREELLKELSKQKHALKDGMEKVEDNEDSDDWRMKRLDRRLSKLKDVNDADSQPKNKKVVNDADPKAEAKEESSGFGMLVERVLEELK